MLSVAASPFWVVLLAVGIGATAMGWFLLWDARDDILLEVIMDPPDKKELCDGAVGTWEWWLYGCFLLSMVPAKLHAHCIGCRIYKWVRGRMSGAAGQGV
jgi:hypothetical protein